MVKKSSLIVMKFGGAALQDLNHLKQSCDLIKKKKSAGYQIIVVVSAMGKTTDYLIGQANEVNPNPPKRELDMLLTSGERISAALVAMELTSKGIYAMSFTGSQSGIITTQSHLDAKIVDLRPYRILDALDQGYIPIIAGFQGVSQNKEITTLGRGGSDTTAVALAVAFEAEVVEFYKDVPGIFTFDPKLDANALCLEELGYDEALNIINASPKKLIHPRAVLMAKKNFIPLFIQSYEKENLPQNRNGSWIRDKFATKTPFKIFESEETLCSSSSPTMTCS